MFDFVFFGLVYVVWTATAAVVAESQRPDSTLKTIAYAGLLGPYTMAKVMFYTIKNVFKK